jgi:hypothetical protein
MQSVLMEISANGTPVMSPRNRGQVGGAMAFAHPSKSCPVKCFGVATAFLIPLGWPNPCRPLMYLPMHAGMHACIMPQLTAGMVAQAAATTAETEHGIWGALRTFQRRWRTKKGLPQDIPYFSPTVDWRPYSIEARRRSGH